MLKIVAVLMLAPVLAFADGIVVPEQDPLSTLLALVQNFNTWAPLVAGSAVIVFLMGVLKKFVGDFNYKRGIIALLGVAYSVFQSRINGLDLVQSLILALVTYGGALAIYEGFVNPVKTQVQK